MNELREMTIRFSDAAEAIGVPKKTLRNWMQRDQINFYTDESKGWRNFCYLDVAVLAIVSKLTEIGMKVEDASNTAVYAISQFPEIAKVPWTPPLALATIFTNRALIIWKSGKGWDCKLVNSLETRSRRAAGNAFIELNVASILINAFTNIDETEGE